MKRVLVTGGSGFLGTHLVNALQERGDEVFAVYRAVRPHPLGFTRTDRLTQLLGDAQNMDFIKRALAEYEIDCVVHLAAQTQVSVGMKNPESVIRENINGTLAVLEAARLVGTKRVVIASTDKVYGELPLHTASGYHETMPLAERTPYGVSKACGDMIAQTYIASSTMSVAITRCGNLYGPGHTNWSTLIPGTIKRIWEGKAPVVRFRGLATRDFLYISDAVAAYLTLIDSNALGAYNFSGGEPLSILTIVEMLISAMAPASGIVPTIVEEGRGEIFAQALDCSSAKNMLGWVPKVKMDKGIQETVAWYMNYLRTASPSSGSCWLGTKIGPSGAPFE